MKIDIETEGKETKLIGNVKWFNNVKGYGFIRHASGKDVFVHYSVIADEGFKTLNEGEEVIYELDTRQRGLFAKNVQKSKATEGTLINSLEEPVENAELK